MKNISVALVLLIAAFSSVACNSNDPKRALIYTKNGEGYVHENIAASVAAMEKICVSEGIQTEVSDLPGVFTTENLERFQVIIFCNSNNEAFDTDEQREAFQNFIRSGGGFVAIHSANASERDWPWYWALVGGKFIRHAPHQEFDILVTDPEHPSTSHLPARWTITDECYYSYQLNPDIHVLLSADMSTVEDKGKDEYPGETFGQQFPLSWCHQFEGGRQWYTALGHDPWFYDDPLFVQHLKGGLQWVMDL